MPSKYKFHNPEGLYFVTLTVVGWIDVFTRSVYRDIFIESLKYSIQKKGLIVHAWVIMSNHVHLIVSSYSGYNLSDIFRDMKKFTSKKITREIASNIHESRKIWMLQLFERCGERNPNNKYVQFWQQENHPIELDTNEMIDQRLDYLHDNPVKAGIIEEAEHYIYSSAINCAGGTGLIEVVLID